MKQEEAFNEQSSPEDLKREYEFWHGPEEDGRTRYVMRGDPVTPFIECHEKWGHTGVVRLGPPLGGRGPMVQVVWDDAEVRWHWPSELRRLEGA